MVPKHAFFMFLLFLPNESPCSHLALASAPPDLEGIAHRQRYVVCVEVSRHIKVLIGSSGIFVIAVIVPKSLSGPVVCKPQIKSQVRSVPGGVEGAVDVGRDGILGC